MKLIKPLIFPKCLDDESPIGYLIRLANINLYGSYRWFIKEQGSPSIGLTEIYELLCRNPWTGFTQNHRFNELNGLSYRYFQTPKIKVCTECVSEGRHWNIYTHAVLSPICYRHKRWKTDACPACTKTYTWHRGDLTKCSCSAPRGDGCERPSEHALELTRFIEAEDMGGIAFRLDPSEFTYKSRCDLFFLFSLHIVNHGKAGNFPRFNNVAELKMCWEEMASILFGELDIFNTFIKTLNSRSPDAFKSFYREFQDFGQHTLDEHREVLIGFITQDLKTPISKQHRSLYGDRPINDIWLPLQTVSREYQIAKSTLNQLIDKGKLRHEIKLFQKRLQTLIYIETPEKFRMFIDQYITHKDARTLLGVTKAQLQQIIENGLLTDVCKPEKSYLKWLISKHCIEKLKDSLHSSFQERDCDRIKISEALSFYSAGFEELLPLLIETLINGQITVVGTTPERYLRNIAIDKEEFIAWRDHKLKSSDKMSIPDLAKRFRINQESMYQIVNAGLIKAEDCGKNRLNRLISESEIVNFQENYALLSRIADVLKRSPVSLKAIIDWRRVQPVPGNNGEQLRQTLYRRKDLLKVDQLHWTITTDGDWWYDRNYPETEAA